MRSGDRSIGWFQKRIEHAIGTSSRARSLARSWRRGGAGLIILCLLVYIPGLWTIPPVDRDESRFAQASRQMLESGTLEGWVVPRVQDKPRLNKPPLIYWLQAGAAAILGDSPGQWAWLDGGSENIWVYRVPSVLSAIAAVLLTWRLGIGCNGGRMFDPRAAWLAAALLAVCPMVVWDAHQARADQLLLAMTTATMLCLWNVWNGGTPGRSHEATTGRAEATVRRRDEATKGRAEEVSGLPPSVAPSLRPSVASSLPPSVPLFWLFLALGIMTKGPITPLIAGLAILTLCLVSRDWSLLRRLRPLLGLLIVAIVVSPWVILVGNEVGWSKYLSIVYDETIGRSAGAKEGHWGPPGYHIVLLGVLFWPGSLLTAAAIGRSWRRGLKANRHTEAKRNTEDTERSTEGAEKGGGVRADDGAGNAEARQEMHAGGSGETRRGPTSLRRSVASSLRRLFSAPLRASVASSLRAFLTSRPGRRAELFCLAWMLPAWIVFELIGTKLPHYTMPLYPAVALMSARMLLGIRTAIYAQNSTNRWPRIDAGSAIWLVLGLMLSFSLPAFLAIGRLLVATDPDSIKNFNQPLDWTEFAIAGVLMLVGVVVMARWFGLLREKRLLEANLRALAVFPIVLVCVFAWLMPRCDLLWCSKRIWDAVRPFEADRTTLVCSHDYKEDSLVFLSRGTFQRMSDEEHVHDAIRRFPATIVVSLERSFWKGIWMKGRDSDVNLANEVNVGLGFNYSTGQKVRPVVFVIQPRTR